MMSPVRTAEPSDGPARAPEPPRRPPDIAPFLLITTVAISIALIAAVTPSPISHTVRAVVWAGGSLAGVYHLLIAVTGRAVLTKSPSRLSGYARCKAAALALLQAGAVLTIVPGLGPGWGLAIGSLGIATTSKPEDESLPELGEEARAVNAHLKLGL